MDKGHSRWRCAQREPFYQLFELGLQAVWLVPVTTPATGQPGEAIAAVLGEPPLRSPQRNAMMTSHVGQRHVAFHAGLEYPIAFQGLRPLAGR
jgi:hypothetical protein